MHTTLPVGDATVELEYQLDKHLVVFSHGFGVRRDARGMFHDVASSLPAGYGFVLFDYDQFDTASQQQTVVGFTARLQRLQAVIQWARTQAGVEQVSVVGHSLGALTIASLAPEQTTTRILIAPPLVLGSRFVEQFTALPTARHEAHTWYIPRQDNTVTVIDDDQLAELMNVDAEGELAKLALFQPYTVILAGADEILPDADYTQLITMPAVTMLGIDQADHNFSGAARSELIQVVVSQLTGAVSETDNVD